MSASPAGLRTTRCARDAHRGARALGAALLLVTALALPAATAHGQGAPRGGEAPWRAPRVLKWTLLAASAGIWTWAWLESREADDAYAALRRLCDRDPGACQLAGGGYADPRAEALYRSSNDGDGRARLGLLAGQATLFGSVAFFIVDLGRGGPPDNIPYDPPADAGAGRPPSGARLKLGVRATFR